jgi:hypothetical protein
MFSNDVCGNCQYARVDEPSGQYECCISSPKPFYRDGRPSRYYPRVEASDSCCEYFPRVQGGLVLASAPKGTKRAAIKGWKLQEHINEKSLAEIAQFLAEAQRRVDAAPAIRGGL